MVIILAAALVVIVVQLIRLYLMARKNNLGKQAALKRQKEFSFLSFITSSALSEDKPITEIFPKIANAYVDMLMGWKFHSIWRLDESRQVLIIRFTGYLPAWYMEELSVRTFIKVGDACIGGTVASKQPLTINIASLDPRFGKVSQLPAKAGYRSLTGAPMMGRLKIYGGINSYSALANVISLHDEQFFMIVGNLYAAILENKLLNNYLTGKSKLIP